MAKTVVVQERVELSQQEFNRRLDEWLFHYTSIPLRNWRVFKYDLLELYKTSNPQEAARIIMISPSLCEPAPQRSAGDLIT